MTDRPTTKKSPSVLLLLAGLATMVVSVSALTRTNPLALFGDLQVGWILVVVAVVVGAVLVLAPVVSGRRRRSKG